MRITVSVISCSNGTLTEIADKFNWQLPGFAKLARVCARDVTCKHFLIASDHVMKIEFPCRINPDQTAQTLIMGGAESGHMSQICFTLK